MASAEVRSLLNDAMNSLRRAMIAVEAEDLATSEAVPASLVNMPPETRAARPATVAAASQLAAEGGDPAVDAMADTSAKTAGADTVKAASDDSRSKK